MPSGPWPRRWISANWTPAWRHYAARLPYGKQQLLSDWKKDLNIFDPNIRGSGLDMQRQLLSDMRVYVQGGATEGLFRVIGSGSSVFYTGGQSLVTRVGAVSNFEIARDPPAGNSYWFAVATMTNSTGKVLVNVQVQASVNGRSYYNKLPTMGATSTKLLYLAYPPGSGYLVNYTLVINGQSLPFSPQTYTTSQNFDVFIRNLDPTRGTQWELYMDSGNFALRQIYPST